MSKFKKYIYTMPEEHHEWGETYASPRCGFAGETVMRGSKLYMGFTVVMKPHVMEEPHFHHAIDEYLMFTGANLVNPFDYDAEIEFSMGEDPDQMEVFTFTEPTVIRVPPNVWHCPINFKRIGKPVNFIPVYPDGTWCKVTQRIKADGSPEYIYDGANTRRCVKNQTKRCTYCGRCFKEHTEGDSTNQ
jgi:oxalate decarboxylase/phosphoglucose isomerase-like protein (cupin superfamily)